LGNKLSNETDMYTEYICKGLLKEDSESQPKRGVSIEEDSNI
jgi:hypothetical protein